MRSAGPLSSLIFHKVSCGRVSILNVLRQGLIFGNGPRHLRQEDRTGTSLSHFRLKAPANDSFRVKQIGGWVHHGSMPVLFPNRTDLCAQGLLRIADQSEWKGALWILPKGVMILVSRLINLGVADDSLPQLPTVLCRLRADSKNGNVVFLISSVFVDEGRNLGPAPGSPLSPIKEDNRRGRRVQDRGECDRLAINIFQDHRRKLCTDFE